MTPNDKLCDDFLSTTTHKTPDISQITTSSDSSIVSTELITSISSTVPPATEVHSLNLDSEKSTGCSSSHPIQPSFSLSFSMEYTTAPMSLMTSKYASIDQHVTQEFLEEIDLSTIAENASETSAHLFSSSMITEEAQLSTRSLSSILRDTTSVETLVGSSSEFFSATFTSRTSSSHFENQATQFMHSTTDVTAQGDETATKLSRDTDVTTSDTKAQGDETATKLSRDTDTTTTGMKPTFDKEAFGKVLEELKVKKKPRLVAKEAPGGQTIGAVAMVILFLIFAGVVLLDLSTIQNHLKLFIRNIRGVCDRENKEEHENQNRK